MKSLSSWILILLLVVVAFFAYRKISHKNAEQLVPPISETSGNIDEQGNGLARRPVQSGGAHRRNDAEGASKGPQGSGKAETLDEQRRGGPRIDPEKKKQLLKGQPVF